MNLPKSDNASNEIPNEKTSTEENPKHIQNRESAPVSSVSDAVDSNDEALSKRKKKKSKKDKKRNKKEKRKKKVRTKQYDDHSDDDSHAESDEDIVDEDYDDNNPDMIKAKEKFEIEKQKVLDKIPSSIKNDFRQIGFTKWGKQILPVIQLSPFDVEPGSVRDQWTSMFKNVGTACVSLT